MAKNAHITIIKNWIEAFFSGMPNTKGTRHSIKITSFNIEGLKSNQCYLLSLTNEADIVCIQEHWLTNCEKRLLADLFPDMNHAVKCYDDKIPVLPKIRTRGHARTAIVWKQKVDHLIEPLKDGSDRVQAIRIKRNGKPVLLINSYMPTLGTTQHAMKTYCPKHLKSSASTLIVMSSGLVT